MKKMSTMKMRMIMMRTRIRMFRDLMVKRKKITAMNTTRMSMMRMKTRVKTLIFMEARKKTMKMTMKRTTMTTKMNTLMRVMKKKMMRNTTRARDAIMVHRGAVALVAIEEEAMAVPTLHVEALQQWTRKKEEE